MREYEPRRGINCGVLVVRPEGLPLYSEPEKPYPKLWCGEQYWLWYLAGEHPGVRYLDDRWNWPAIRPDFRDRLWKWIFVHLNGVHDPVQRLAMTEEIIAARHR